MFAFGIEFDHGGKGSSELAAKAFERADATQLEDGLHFFAFKCATGHGFPNNGSTFRATFEGLEGFHVADVRAFWTLHIEVLKRSADGIALERFGLVDNVLCESTNLLHELGSIQCALLHLLELELPFSGHFRRGERLDTETTE